MGNSIQLYCDRLMNHLRKDLLPPTLHLYRWLHLHISTWFYCISIVKGLNLKFSWVHGYLSCNHLVRVRITQFCWLIYRIKQKAHDLTFYFLPVLNRVLQVSSEVCRSALWDCGFLSYQFSWFDGSTAFLSLFFVDLRSRKRVTHILFRK